MNKHDFKMELRREIIGKKEARISKVNNMVVRTNGST
jgi:hypothetical protein